MTVKNITGTPYLTIDDIERKEIKSYLQADCSLASLSKVGYAFTEYLSKLDSKNEVELKSGLHDIMIIFTILQSKALEIRLLSSQLKHALNLQIENEENDSQK